MSAAAESTSDHRTPFPLPPSPEEQAEWVAAALATPGVNVPREALENVAPFLVRPSDTLTDPDGNGIRRIRDAALRPVPSDSGDMLTAIVKMHGVGGSVWEHNERISSEWHSAANPAAPRDGQQTLPRINPFTRITLEGSEKTFAAVEMVADSRESLIANLDRAATALAKQDGRRTFNLQEDLVLNGQKEPGLYLAQHIKIQEDALLDRDGHPLHPQAHWQWMAVRGNNRTKQRHEIFGVSSAEVVTGVSLKNIGGVGEQVIFDANRWLTQLSQLLNEEWAKVKSGETELEPPSRALRAERVAVVEAHLVIGCPTPSRLYRIAQMSNRRDHVHPPLEFTPNDRSRALGRSVLGAYVAEGLLDEKTAEVLSGSAPVTELIQGAHDASVSELRDIRSMMLLSALFPKERRKQFSVRRTLSEAPPSQLSSPEINRRARAWSALTSESYPDPWNPRIGEVFQLGEIREGIKVSGRPLKELLHCADTDGDAFEELIAYRAAHWLAAFDIIDADRGSLTGQKTEDDLGAKADRVRRTVRNSLNAMRNQPGKAVGVLRELASAMDEGDRRPRKVSVSGEPLIEPMTRAWFNREFPKESGTRPQPSRRQAPRTPLPSALDDALRADEEGGTFQATEPPSDEQRTGPPVGEEAGLGTSAPGPAPEAPFVPLDADRPHDLVERVRRLAADTTALKELVNLLLESTGQGNGPCSLTRGEADSAAQVLFAASTDLRGMVPHLDRLANPS